eukprot:Skav219439  [mRNA]  locus=scaffold1461:124632:129212:- [translate_table: standard]
MWHRCRLSSSASRPIYLSAEDSTYVINPSMLDGVFQIHPGCNRWSSLAGADKEDAADICGGCEAFRAGALPPDVTAVSPLTGEFLFAFLVPFELEDDHEFVDLVRQRAVEQFELPYFAFEAVEAGDLPAVKHWLKMGQDPNSTAIRQNHWLVARLLIKAHANVDYAPPMRLGPLHMAVAEDAEDCATLLLRHGANPNLRARTIAANTPLHLAAVYGDAVFTDILLSHGADALLRDAYDTTPLTLATPGPVVSLLLDKCYGRVDCVNLLERHACDIMGFVSNACFWNICKRLNAHKPLFDMEGGSDNALTWVDSNVSGEMERRISLFHVTCCDYSALLCLCPGLWCLLPNPFSFPSADSMWEVELAKAKGALSTISSCLPTPLPTVDEDALARVDKRLKVFVSYLRKHIVRILMDPESVSQFLNPCDSAISKRKWEFNLFTLRQRWSSLAGADMEGIADICEGVEEFRVSVLPPDVTAVSPLTGDRPLFDLQGGSDNAVVSVASGTVKKQKMLSWHETLAAVAAHNRHAAADRAQAKKTGARLAGHTSKVNVQGLIALSHHRVEGLLPPLLRDGYLARSIIPQKPRTWPCSPPLTVDHLKFLNPNEADGRLVFQQLGHAYFWDEQKIGQSVTQLIHAHSHDFDPQAAIAGMRRSSNWPRPQYLKANLPYETWIELHKLPYAKPLLGLLAQSPKNDVKVCEAVKALVAEHPEDHFTLLSVTLSDGEIQQQWSQAAVLGASLGTWMHATFENLLNGGYVTEADAEIDLFLRFLRSVCLPFNWQVYRTEWTMYAKEEDLAGSIDCVMITPDGALVLVDWKRTQNLPNKFESFGKNMLPPLGNVPDAVMWHYRLQLNIYRYILETYYEKRVSHMLVVGCHPDNGGYPFVDQVPWMKPEVDNLMRQARLDARGGALRATRFDVAEQVTPPREDQQGLSDDMLGGASQDDGPSFDERIAAEDDLPGDSFMAEELGVKREEHEASACLTAGHDPVEVAESQPAWEACKDELGDELGEERVDGETIAKIKRRRLLKGAFTSATDFRDLFQGYGDIVASELATLERDSSNSEHATLERSKIFRASVRNSKPTWSEEMVRLGAALIAACATCDCPSKPVPGPGMEEQEVEEGGAAGPEEKAAAMEPWMAGVAKRLWRMCHSLRSELMHERLISLLVEWCETPRAESACVAYKDTCVEFLPDSEEKVLRYVQKSPANNCYLYIPHSLLDPVLEANCAKLSEFYAHTFWANKDVFLCCQAALALAKRGINVDRCFIGESPGGVGQSLYSLHLATMLGNNHGFFDPNVWYNEDELRKQVETFARRIVVTGQEAPESAKKLHLDLF